MTKTPVPGLFISLEGIDGAGKSSHLAFLADLFRDREVVQTREPGGTPLAEQLRELLLHKAMDAMTEALLAFAARRDHVQRCVAPALGRGAVVLCDRFTDSSFAYQGGGRGLSSGTLQALERMVQGSLPGFEPLLEPHVTLWFDLAPELAAQRLAAGRTGSDRFEGQGLAFFARVQAAYAQRAAAAPQRFARIEANAPAEEVRAHILRALRQRGRLPPHD